MPLKRQPDSGSLTRRRLLGTGMGAGAGVVLAACGGPATLIKAPSGRPQRGGTLRVGLTGGGASDTVDAHSAVNTTDIARVVNLYEPLLYRDDDYKLKPVLATSLTPSRDATVWTAELRRDVVFHDGRPMTGKDVAASFARITNPKDPKSGAASLTDLHKVVVVGRHTVEFRLKAPSAAFDDQLGQYSMGIVPADYDPKNPIGTGPFKYKSFTAGQQSVFTRFDKYWRPGEPYLDTLVISNFNDDDALVNALLSTQVDAIGQIPLALTEVIGADPRINVLISHTGAWMPFTMRIDKAPFNDKRVREAFRLAVDRKQMIEQVYSGHGRVANDMYAPYDPGYAKDLPQRHQDPAKAKKLLAEAGHPDGLDVTLVTAPIQSGAVEAAQVFAQQAKKSGIRIKIRRVDSTTFFGDNYLKWDFAQDFWYTRNFLPQVDSGTAQDAPFNETHWKNAKFTSLVGEATKTINDAHRNRLIGQAQKILYEEGGYIIWGFSDQADAYQKYVAGLVPNRTGISLSGYQFRRVWLGAEK